MLFDAHETDQLAAAIGAGPDPTADGGGTSQGDTGGSSEPGEPGSGTSEPMPPGTDPSGPPPVLMVIANQDFYRDDAPLRIPEGEPVDAVASDTFMDVEADGAMEEGGGTSQGDSGGSSEPGVPGSGTSEPMPPGPPDSIGDDVLRGGEGNDLL